MYRNRLSLSLLGSRVHDTILSRRSAVVVSYTPEQRRMFRNGLRIWARVAIRSYMRKHGTALSLPEAAPDGGEEESQ